MFSRPRRDRDVPKNISRLPRDRDVQDRYYVPGKDIRYGKFVVLLCICILVARHVYDVVWLAC